MLGPGSVCLCALTQDPALDLYLYNLGAYVCNRRKILSSPSSVTSCVSPATSNLHALSFHLYFYIFNSLTASFRRLEIVIQPPRVGREHTHRCAHTAFYPQHQQDAETLQNATTDTRAVEPKFTTPAPAASR